MLSGEFARLGTYLVGEITSSRPRNPVYRAERLAGAGATDVLLSNKRNAVRCIGPRKKYLHSDRVLVIGS